MDKTHKNNVNQENVDYQANLRSIAIVNMLVILIVSSSGWIIVSRTYVECGKEFECGNLCKATLATLIVVFFISGIGVTLTACVFLSPGSNIHRKCYSLVSLYLIKSIEIGGLIFSELCLLAFPIMPSKHVWCISISPIIFLVVIAVIILFDVYFLIKTVKTDEKLRNTCGNSSWGEVRRERREKKNENIELQEFVVRSCRFKLP